MRVLFRLAINNIKKYKIESFLAILSMTLTISLITIVTIFSASLYASFAQSVEKVNPFNVDVIGVKNPSDFIDALGDSVGYYEMLDYNHNFTVDLRDEGLAEPYQAVRNIKKVWLSDQISKELRDKTSLVAGRESNHAHEIVVPKYLNFELGDTLLLQDDLSGSFVEGTVVGISEDSELYFFEESYFKNSSDESVDAYGIRIAFKDGVRNIEKIIEHASKDNVVDDMFSVVYNQDLNFTKRFQSTPGSSVLPFFVLGLMLVLVVGIMTFTLILNAFDALFTNKHQTFNVLRTIGASRVQISLMIFFEGLILSVVGLVVGIGIGVLLSHSLIDFISHTVSTVQSLEYGIQTPLTLIYYFPKPLVLVISLLSLVVVFIVLSIRLKVLYQKNAVSSVYQSVNNKRKKYSLKGRLIPSLAKINRKLMNDLKGIRNALIISVAVIIVVNTLTGLILSVNDNLTSKYHTYIALEQRVASDFESDTLDISKALSQTENVEDFISYLEWTTLRIDYDNHDLLYPDREFNKSHTQGFLVWALSDSDYEKMLESNNLPSDTNTLLINTLKSYQDIGLKLNDEDNALDIKSGESLSFIYDDLVGNQKNMNINVDVVVESLKKETSFSRIEANALVIRTKDVKNHFGDVIEPDRGMIAISGDFNEDKLVLLMDIISNLELTSQTFVYSDLTTQYIVKTINRAIRTASIVIFAYLGFVFLINIVSISLTSIKKRKKDFAVLRSIGASVSQVKQMLLLESVAVVLQAWLIGAIIGNSVSYLFYLFYTRTVVYIHTPVFSINIFANFLTFSLVILALLVLSISISLEMNRSNLIEDIRSY